MTAPEPELPIGVVWRQRPFPDANFLLLLGAEPSLIDTGFTAHADATAHLAHTFASRVDRVASTHWHSDHVGGNALFQHAGAEIIGSVADAEALGRADPGCCLAEYLDQPVPQYTIDRAVADADRILLGDSEWTVRAVPGHTPGHLAYWNPEHRVLAAGDTLSAYDVGWVNVMREGMTALDAAIGSLTRLQELDARVILPGHGAVITRPAETIAKAIQRLERQRASIGHTVTYGAKRILAFALMIRDGMTPADLDGYLHNRIWAKDAARTLSTTVEDFARTLVDSMLTSGALILAHGTVRAAAETSGTDPAVFDLPYPRHWRSDRARPR